VASDRQGVVPGSPPATRTCPRYLGLIGSRGLSSNLEGAGARSGLGSRDTPTAEDGGLRSSAARRTRVERACPRRWVLEPIAQLAHAGGGTWIEVARRVSGRAGAASGL
jgi:hypothetical protein